MNDNKNLPAFPVLELKQLGDKLLLDCTAAGVSKLEFFACNAPVDIPGWFKHTPPEKIVCQEPSYDEIDNIDDKETCRSWRLDPCYDLPDHLKWFQDRVEQSHIAYSENVRKDNEAKYFQWRRYYAEQLLAELSKS